MQLIDTHQHLIYRDHIGYDWANGIPELAQGNFTTQDYAELVRGKGVIGSIFMETAANDADYQAEARMVAKFIGQDGMLGQIASCRPETNAGFDAWLEECGNLGVRGFRRVLHVVPDDVSISQIFRSNLRKIGAAGYTFDICMLARQLPLAADLIRACPDMTFVLDHCGVPDIAGNAFDEWATGMADLARLPNLFVKLSGIPAYCATGTATIETLRPWVDHVLETFGPNRMIWGGDWPVVNLGTGLPKWIDLTGMLLSGLSDDERAKIGNINARSVYKID